MRRELNYEKYLKYITIDNKVNYILSKIENDIILLANEYNMSAEIVEGILKEKLLFNINCINSEQSLDRYIRDALEFCEYELQKKQDERFCNQVKRIKERDKLGGEKYIASFESKYLNSIKDKVDFFKYAQCLEGSETYIVEKLYGNNCEEKNNAAEILNVLNISGEELEDIKARIRHKLVMEINPRIFLKLINKKSKVMSFECMGSFKGSRCLHNGDTFICLKAKECKELTNNKKGKCVCEFKSRCPKIRQSVFMKYKPTEEDKKICEFYNQFKLEKIDTM